MKIRLNGKTIWAKILWQLVPFVGKCDCCGKWFIMIHPGKDCPNIEDW